MGHVVNSGRVYRRLQRRLDGTMFGAPESPVFTKILQLLFSPEDAVLAIKIPTWLTPLDDLAAGLGIPRDELGGRLHEMAQRGLIYDVSHKGRRYFALAPFVFGFFEFSFMRTRDDISLAELARLFDRYMREDDRPARSVFQGQMQPGRALVHEEALPEGDHTEVLDWERTSQIVRSASAIGVSICACRHEASHLGRACDRPLRSCLAFNYAAESLIRNGFADQITIEEAEQILQECKDAGLAQLGDSVRSRVSYICNCCGCCCEMVQAVKCFDIRGAILTSNWIVEVDARRCTGCGKCAEVCPVDAIDMTWQTNGKKPRSRAVPEETLCLGCGVCQARCESGAIRMTPREQRVFTPRTYIERIVTMAIERGKLAELVFDNPQRLSHRALGPIARVIEKSPVFKAAMAIKPLQSAFLNRVVANARRNLGDLCEIYEQDIPL